MTQLQKAIRATVAPSDAAPEFVAGFDAGRAVALSAIRMMWDSAVTAAAVADDPEAYEPPPTLEEARALAEVATYLLRSAEILDGMDD